MRTYNHKHDEGRFGLLLQLLGYAKGVCKQFALLGERSLLDLLVDGCGKGLFLEKTAEEADDRLPSGVLFEFSGNHFPRSG